jgi:hypothetical protein
VCEHFLKVLKIATTAGGSLIIAGIAMPFSGFVFKEDKNKEEKKDEMGLVDLVEREHSVQVQMFPRSL